MASEESNSVPPSGKANVPSEVSEAPVMSFAKIVSAKSKKSPQSSAAAPSQPKAAKIAPANSVATTVTTNTTKSTVCEPVSKETSLAASVELTLNKTSPATDKQAVEQLVKDKPMAKDSTTVSAASTSAPAKNPWFKHCDKGKHTHFI